MSSTTTTTTTRQDGTEETTTTTVRETGTLTAFISAYATLILLIFIGWVLAIVAWWKMSSNCEAISAASTAAASATGKAVDLASSYRTLNTVSSVFPILGIFTSSPVIHWINQAAKAAKAAATLTAE